MPVNPAVKTEGAAGGRQGAGGIPNVVIKQLGLGEFWSGIQSFTFLLADEHLWKHRSSNMELAEAQEKKRREERKAAVKREKEQKAAAATTSDDENVIHWSFLQSPADTTTSLAAVTTSPTVATVAPVVQGDLVLIEHVMRRVDGRRDRTGQRHECDAEARQRALDRAVRCARSDTRRQVPRRHVPQAMTGALSDRSRHNAWTAASGLPTRRCAADATGHHAVPDLVSFDRTSIHDSVEPCRPTTVVDAVLAGLHQTSVAMHAAWDGRADRRRR